MAPNVIAGEAREVMKVSLSSGKKWVMWVAPTRAGGFCMPSGCDRDRSLPFAPGLAVPGPVSPTGEILAPPVIFEGDTLIQGASTVEIQFEEVGADARGLGIAANRCGLLRLRVAGGALESRPSAYCSCPQGCERQRASSNHRDRSRPR
jgi:hypothetical protein